MRRLKAEVLQTLASTRARGESIVLVTELQTGDQQLLPVKPGGSVTSEDLPQGLLGFVDDAVRFDRSVVVEHEERAYFLHVFNPPPRIIVVGAVHIAQPLTVMAREAGFDVVVIDPREAFATEERFPGTAVLRMWPKEGLTEAGIDHRTAVVTVTHDPKLDDPALQFALRSSAFYVGALGSRRTHAKRLARLEEAGFGPRETDSIYAPVGLSIGARTPGEIAASVLAQVVQVLRTGEA